MDIEQLSDIMFVKNIYNSDMSFDMNSPQELTVKQLSGLLYSLFMRGLVILYGDGARVTLNHLSLEQVNRVVDKMRLAKIKTHFNVYDRCTAVLLDLVPETTNIPLEIYVTKQNQTEINKNESKNLRDYVYRMYLSGKLYCVSFEIVR